jgi:hypothetical protein
MGKNEDLSFLFELKIRFEHFQLKKALKKGYFGSSAESFKNFVVSRSVHSS